MAKQKIVRMKIVVTIPYVSLTEGAAAYTALAAARQKGEGWKQLVDNKTCEIEFSDIEETARILHTPPI